MPRAALGTPLKAASEFEKPTDDEINNVNRRWDESVPAKYRGLLDAKPLGSDDASARWFWDARRGQYVDKAGRYLSKRELRAAWVAYSKAIAKK